MSCCALYHPLHLPDCVYAMLRYITAQKTYMLDTHEELFKIFQKQHPRVKLQLKKFIELAPWYSAVLGRLLPGAG